MVAISSHAGWSVEVPPLGFGCCPMGGHGWGCVDDDQLIRAVETALDLGVRLFDTSDIYGLGKSETLLGKALGSRRHEAVIATKFGVRHEGGKSFFDTSLGWMRTAIEGSLRRLGVECIDLYQMHYWDEKTPLEDIVSLLEGFIDAGKIRSYGVTNLDPRSAAVGGARSRMASYSYQYSLIERHRECDLLAIQEAGRSAFLAWGSLGQGILSGKYSSLEQLDPGDRRRREVYASFHGERFAAVQSLVAEMRGVAAEAGISSISQLALMWIIRRIPRAVPLVGIKTPEQIRDVAGVLGVELGAAHCERLDRLTGAFLTPAKVL